MTEEQARQMIRLLRMILRLLIRETNIPPTDDPI